MMIKVGRFHLVRVVLGAVFVLLLIGVISNWNDSSGTIKLPPDSIHAVSMTAKEIDELTQANTSCPICFGRDACQELMSDISKGVLKVSSQIQYPEGLDQAIYGVYRHGKLRFWMKPKPPSPGLLQGFENYICAKASKSKKHNNCDISVAAKSSEFLYAINPDLESIRGIYKYHLVSRRRIPMTICPSWKLVQGLIQSFDDNEDLALTGEEKVTMITTLATNPEVALYKFMVNQKVQIPVLPYFGACGRITFVQGPYKPLSLYVKENLALRVHLSAQILQMIDGFIQDDEHWLLFTRDLSYQNFIVTDANQVFLKDLSHVMLIDKDMYNLGGNSAENERWSEEKFDEFYDDLVDDKGDDYTNKCAKIFDYAAHMFSLACRFVLSDLETDVEFRRQNPLAKSFPGLLHHMDEKVDGEEKPVIQDVKLVESLLSRCSSSPFLETRQEAGLQLLQELSLEQEAETAEGDDDGDNIGLEDNGRDEYEAVQDGPPDGDTTH